MSDEAMNEPTAEQEADVALGEATPEPAEELEPEEFDLAEWLEGLGPEVARYPLPGGGYIPLRARTDDWRAEWSAEHKDATDDAAAIAFLAGHVVDEKVTPEMLAKLRLHRPRDFELATGLAIFIDSQSSSEINPAFLPGASD